MATTLIRIRRRFLAGVVLALAMIGGAGASTLYVVVPDWAELPMDTQAILAPLGPEWNQLESINRRKWLQIAARYPTMPADEQARVQKRMRDWAKLTPEQRKAARERYANVRKAPAEQRAALREMWQQYQALPDEEKARLQEKSKSKAATPPPAGEHR